MKLKSIILSVLPLGVALSLTLSCSSDEKKLKGIWFGGASNSEAGGVDLFWDNVGLVLNEDLSFTLAMTNKSAGSTTPGIFLSGTWLHDDKPEPKNFDFTVTQNGTITINPAEVLLGVYDIFDANNAVGTLLLTIVFGGEVSFGRPTTHTPPYRDGDIVLNLARDSKK